MAAEDAQLVIDDDYVKGVGTARQEFGSELDQLFDEYLKALKAIVDEAIPSGAQHDAASAFYDQVSALVKDGGDHRLTTMSNALKTDCDNFITQIDADDKFLY